MEKERKEAMGMGGGFVLGLGLEFRACDLVFFSEGCSILKEIELNGKGFGMLLRRVCALRSKFCCGFEGRVVLGKDLLRAWW